MHKMRFLKMLGKYMIWMMTAPNTRMAMNGLAADLTGDLHSWRRRI